MIATMRSKFGPIVIGSIIGLIAFVFIFYGIFSPGGGGGSSAPSIAGEVNGEVISYAEFSRALNQRIEFFKSLMGGKVDEEQLAQFKIREAVFQDLANRKLTVQIAKKEGFYPSAEQVRDQILGMDVFKKDGHFDKVHYKAVLTQNQYTPARFEEMIAQDLVEQSFKSFIANLAVVSPLDVEKELKASKERRKLRFVYVDHEAIRKTLPKDIKADDMNKQVNEKTESLTKELLPLISSGQDKKADALLKSLNLKTKTSEWLTAQSDFIGGVGSIRSAQNEIFNHKKGDPAKAYPLVGGTLIAAVADAEYFDASKVTPKDRSEVAAKLQNQKQNEVAAELMKQWTKKASITRNDTVVVGGKGQHVPVSADN